MHFFKGDIEYLSETNWDMFEVGPKAETLKSANDNLDISLPTLGKTYWFIIANTIGFPPNNESLDPQKIILPVYGIFSIAPPFDKNAAVKLKIESRYLFSDTINQIGPLFLFKIGKLAGI